MIVEIPSGLMLTNSGMFTARLGAVELGTRIAGPASPFSSIWVRNIWVNGVNPLDEKTSHLPFGEKLCQEFMSGKLHWSSRALPPPAGMI